MPLPLGEHATEDCMQCGDCLRALCVPHKAASYRQGIHGPVSLWHARLPSLYIAFHGQTWHEKCAPKTLLRLKLRLNMAAVSRKGSTGHQVLPFALQEAHRLFIALHGLALQGGRAQQAVLCVRLIVGVVAVQNRRRMTVHAGRHQGPPRVLPPAAALLYPG